MTDTELLEIEQACEKATPGPWTRQKPAKNADGWSLGVCVAATSPSPNSRIYATPPSGVFPDNDASFIAGARSWLPLLCREVRELRKERDTARELLAITLGDHESEVNGRIAAESSHRLLVERLEKQEKVQK